MCLPMVRLPAVGLPLRSFLLCSRTTDAEREECEKTRLFGMRQLPRLWQSGAAMRSFLPCSRRSVQELLHRGKTVR